MVLRFILKYEYPFWNKSVSRRKIRYFKAMQNLIIRASFVRLDQNEDMWTCSTLWFSALLSTSSTPNSLVTIVNCELPYYQYSKILFYSYYWLTMIKFITVINNNFKPLANENSWAVGWCLETNKYQTWLVRIRMS